MTPSELTFLNGVWIMTICSLIMRNVTGKLFITTMTEEDKETLEKQLDRSIKIHSHILAWVNVISGLSFFFNSAILGALVIKEFIL